MFTASHNPAQYNGIKMCLPGATPIGQDTGLAELKEMAKTGVPDAPGPRGGRSPLDMLRDFAAHVRSFAAAAALSPLTIVAATPHRTRGPAPPDSEARRRGTERFP